MLISFWVFICLICFFLRSQFLFRKPSVDHIVFFGVPMALQLSTDTFSYSWWSAYRAAPAAGVHAASVSLDKLPKLLLPVQLPQPRMCPWSLPMIGRGRRLAACQQDGTSAPLRVLRSASATTLLRWAPALRLCSELCPSYHGILGIGFGPYASMYGLMITWIRPQTSRKESTFCQFSRPC